mmetsp:Transcript_21166/g.33960  ORF Transcript_21166/g.33960 Transcript_21166/m.33960 type:complete len:215 (+) Transcript_21166:389-1033(+)
MVRHRRGIGGRTCPVMALFRAKPLSGGGGGCVGLGNGGNYAIYICLGVRGGNKEADTWHVFGYAHMHNRRRIDALLHQCFGDKNTVVRCFKQDWHHGFANGRAGMQASRGSFLHEVLRIGAEFCNTFWLVAQKSQSRVGAGCGGGGQAYGIHKARQAKPHPFDYVRIGRNKSARRGEALRKSADGDFHALWIFAKMLTETAAGFAQHTVGMRFV